MGQQQLLLIMLSVIVVGVGIAMGVVLFSTNGAEQKRNEVINECAMLASEAQLYFRRPIVLGGGGKSFVGWDIPQQYKSTEAGSFEISALTATEVKITGTGNEVVTDGDSVQVIVTVNPLAYSTEIIN
jgi:hypothetical protein